MSRVSAQFEPQPSEARSARRFVTEAVGSDRRPIPEFLPLLTSELASNAVVHARTPFTVSVIFDANQVRVEVRDGNPQLPVPAEPDIETVTGRGLLLISELADRWGVEGLPTGKLVWIELDRDEAATEDGVA